MQSSGMLLGDPDNDSEFAGHIGEGVVVGLGVVSCAVVGAGVVSVAVV
jgi:hypothetical protein